jgi:hypothetical protein
MAITIPRFFPQPWAANEVMMPLTPEEMAAGYPSGTNEKPTRQSINNALQYAINGVLYYLTTGVPAWILDAEYNVGSIVSFDDSFYHSIADANAGHYPDALAGWWEQLPWRKSDLDKLYLTQAQAEEIFLSPEAADEHFHSREAAYLLFLTQANAAIEFVTKAALEEHYLTTEQAEALFLTEAQADERYVLKGDVISREQLDETLADFITRTDAAATFITPEQADARFMTEADASAVFETQADAQATFLALDNAGLRIFRPTDVYNAGAMVLDTTTSIIYQSVRDDNTGNSLADTVFWRPWLTSIAVDVLTHYIEFSTFGTFAVNASDIPTLATHPDGIHLRIVMKGSGGWGGGFATAAGHGGGEGGMTELVLQGIITAMFPMTVTIAESVDVRFTQAPGQAQFGIMGGWGGMGTQQQPGAGGPAPNPFGGWQPFVVSIVRTPGANGRWGVHGLRGGDGGGVLGGSGLPAGATPTIANGRRGCGGGGTLNNPAIARGGDGFVQIYW